MFLISIYIQFSEKVEIFLFLFLIINMLIENMIYIYVGKLHVESTNYCLLDGMWIWLMLLILVQFVLRP